MTSGQFIRLGVVVVLFSTLYGVMSGSAYAGVDESARDEFAAISYGGSDGTIDWTGAWSEIGETDGPTSGVIDVVNSSRCAIANCLRFGGDAADIDGHGVWREVDLSAATSAQLTFSYRREPMGPTGAIAVAISGDGGGSWSTLTTYDFFGNANQIDASFDVSAYSGPNTRIRFLCEGTGVSAYLYVDDIEITASFLDPASPTTTQPPQPTTTTTTTQPPQPTTTTTTTQPPQPTTTTTTTQPPQPTTTTTTTQPPQPTTVAGGAGPPDAPNYVAGSLSPIQGLTVAFDTAVEALTGIAFPAIALGILTAGLTIAGLERRRDRAS